jgi:hypothetical protein
MTNFIVKHYDDLDHVEVVLDGGGAVWSNNAYQDSDIAYTVAFLLNHYHGIEELKSKLGESHPHVLFQHDLVRQLAWRFVYSSDIKYRVSDEIRRVMWELLESKAPKRG